MTLDINKIKAAAIRAVKRDYAETPMFSPETVLELIERLENAERDAARWHEYQARKTSLLKQGFGQNPMRDIAAMKESE